MALIEEISFSAVNDNLPDILAWIEKKSSAYLPSQIALRLQLAAEEVVVNVVNYAFKENTVERLIWLRFGQDENFYLEIADNGMPFNPLENITNNPDVPLEDRIPGGWGRTLIVKMTSAVSYKYCNNTNILRLEENPADFAELSV